MSIDAATVVITGENGSGKTNLLEAVSLFAQGRGLRRADLAACVRHGAASGFAISLEVAGFAGTRQFGSGFETGADETPVRRFRVDREPAGSARAFAADLRIVWLTPAMDGLFTGPPAERRRFLDRLVLALDADHGARVNALDRALRQRNRALEVGQRADPYVLDAIERELAELAVAVCVARGDTIVRLMNLQTLSNVAFPRASLSLVGEVDDWCARDSALAAEDRYRDLLCRNRGLDAAAGRTTVGPHTADLRVQHTGKAIDAALCSTGEQKALLVSLVLAHARLVTDVSGIAPVMLLDEIAAHFDAGRRAALFGELRALPGQVWMTGADKAAFSAIEADAQWLHVTPGRVDLAAAILLDADVDADGMSLAVGGRGHGSE